MLKLSRLKLLTGAGLGLVASALALLPGKAQAQGVNTGLHYQGRLTSPDGTPVADNSYDVTFALFANPTGGAALWSESTTVATKGGAFSTMLGRVMPLSPGLFTQSLWPEITVAGRTLLPRQEFGASPYAMAALSVPAGAVTNAMIAVGSITADRLADHTITERQLAPGIAVPVGRVVSWWGNAASPPDGWAVCAGQTLSDAGSALNGSALPDLRNKFVMGGVGNARSTPQAGGRASMNLAHTHNVNAHTHDIATDLNVGTLKALGHNHLQSNGTYTGGESSSGVTGGFNGSGFLLMVNGNGGQSTQNLGHNHGGVTGVSTPATSASLTDDQSIIPPYIGLIYIMRVR